MSKREIEDNNREITKYEIPRSTTDLLDKMARMAIPGDNIAAKIFRTILIAYGTLHFSMMMYYSKRFSWGLVGTQWSEYRKTITKASLEIFKKTIEEVIEADYDIGALNCIFMEKKDYNELYDKMVEKIDNDIDNAVLQIREHLENNVEDDYLKRTIEEQQLNQLENLRSLAGSAKEIIKQKLLSEPSQRRPSNKLLSLPAPNPCTDGDKRGCKESKEYLDKMFKKIQDGAQKVFRLVGKATGGSDQCKIIIEQESDFRLRHLENIAPTMIRYSNDMIKKTQMKLGHNAENANFHKGHFTNFLLVIVFFQFMRILYNYLLKKKKRRSELENNSNKLTYNFTHKKSMKSRLNKLNKKQLETLCKKMKKQIKNTKSGMVKSLLQPLY